MNTYCAQYSTRKVLRLGIQESLFTVGFSLVELLIYMSLLGVFLLVMSSTLMTMLEVKADVQARSIVEAEAHFIRERITYDLKRSRQVFIPGSLGSISPRLELLTYNDQNIRYDTEAQTLFFSDQTGVKQRMHSTQTKVSAFQVSALGSESNLVMLVDFTLESMTQVDGKSDIQNMQVIVTQR